jgi:hypothetical protein
MSAGASIYGPDGEPIPDQVAASSAPEGQDSGPQQKTRVGHPDEDSGPGFFYRGRRVEREQFFENRNRIVKPGPGGCLIAERVGDVVIVRDVAGEILGFAAEPTRPPS